MNQIIVEFINHQNGRSVDLQLPSTISGRVLVEALDRVYGLGLMSLAPEQRYLQAQYPNALVRGDSSLEVLGLRDGSVIHFIQRRELLDEHQ